MAESHARLPARVQVGPPLTFSERRYLSGFLISSVMKLSVSQPEYEYRAAYRASAMSPGFTLEPAKEFAKFWVSPGGERRDAIRIGWAPCSVETSSVKKEQKRKQNRTPTHTRNTVVQDGR